MKIFFILFFGFFLCQIKTKFTNHFFDFIVTNYGLNTAKELDRPDLDFYGSFGGRENELKPLINKVHIYLFYINKLIK